MRWGVEGYVCAGGVEGYVYAGSFEGDVCTGVLRECVHWGC